MDVSTLISYIPLIIQYGPTVKAILDTATNNTDTAAKLEAQVKPVIGLLEQLGAALFPQAAKAIHVVGGAMAAFDPNVTKWVQGACNNIAKVSPPLVVDGVYGPLTRNAVIVLQQKLGLDKADGLAGQITQAAIDAFYAKQALAAPAAA